ncbi:MAG TPA: HD domain-containing phosphohydrolase [Acidisarcina sp.]
MQPISSFSSAASYLGGSDEASTGAGYGRVRPAALPQRTPPAQGAAIPLSDIVSALSFALDLTEDAVPGHAVRSCLLGMQMANALGLREGKRADLYYALLLKDIGCSSNSARMCQIIGGDDRQIKSAVKLEDWTRPSLSSVKMLWNSVLPGSGALSRSRRILRTACRQRQNNAELIGLRCERGANIVAKIGLTFETGDAIRHLDEHWDGSGYPDHLRGEEIPLDSRILNLAQHLDVFCSERGPDAALEVVRDRSGRWFDPGLVKVVESLARRKRLWTSSGISEDRAKVLALAPAMLGETSLAQIDTICEAFADVVDAKSSFTYQHSLGVTKAASLIAKALGLDEVRQRLVYRAALLHDLGKLRVPNCILDKPGKLTDEEWKVVREHPGLSQQILGRIAGFEEISLVAGQHHEKLDGTGYPLGLSAAELSVEARILAVADVYGALSETRPYRGPLELSKIVEIMSELIPHKVDRACFEALVAGLKT